MVRTKNMYRALSRLSGERLLRDIFGLSRDEAGNALNKFARAQATRRTNNAYGRGEARASETRGAQSGMAKETEPGRTRKLSFFFMIFFTFLVWFGLVMWVV